jgi:hypothetical protein
VAWRGVAWRGVVRRGVVWCGVAWRGVAWPLYVSQSNFPPSVLRHPQSRIGDLQSIINAVVSDHEWFRPMSVAEVRMSQWLRENPKNILFTGSSPRVGASCLPMTLPPDRPSP